MKDFQVLDAELDEVGLRWPRALAWAKGESLGPHAQGVRELEANAIEALSSRILEAGEETAWDEYVEGQW